MVILKGERLMKRNLLAILTVALLVGSLVTVVNIEFSNAQTTVTTWTTQTIDPVKDAGACSSIVLDSTNKPHVCYMDENSNLKYAKYTGTTWTIQTIEKVTGKISITIVVDSNNYPHIAYSSDTNLKYVHWNGINWITETVTTATFTFVSDLDLTIDSSNKPHISYYDNGYKNLKYATKNGSNWITQLVDSAEGSGLYNSIAVDSNNNPHISYFNDESGALKYAYYNGITWTTQTVYSSIGKNAIHTSIAIDTTNRPHISFIDYQNNQAKYAKHNGASWTIETVGPVNDMQTPSTIALDSSNNPHIVYGYFIENNTQTGQFTYATRNSANWTYYPATLPNTNKANYLSFALDSTNKPHITYQGLTNNGALFQYATEPTIQIIPTPPPTPQNKWHWGNGIPPTTLGINGDFYLNTNNSYIYTKELGTWIELVCLQGATGPQGPQGLPGTAGATWHSGATTPSNTLGTGDFY